MRSRSTSAAGAVQVRVRAIARRISADKGTPAAFALARQSADSPGVRRTATRIGRRLAIGTRRHGGKGGDAPARAIHRSAGLLGFEGAESLASPTVIPWVGWLAHLKGAQTAPRQAGRDGFRRRESRVGGVSMPYTERPAPKPCQQPESRRLPKTSRAVPEPRRAPPVAPPSRPEGARDSSRALAMAREGVALT